MINRLTPTDRERAVHFTALVRGPETYVVIWTARYRTDACKTLGRWASDPELDFTWYDAARMSAEIRRECP